LSAWRVELGFSEGSSNKFWRARVEGGTLYVNYGRIGSDGQTQVKELGTAAAAERELEKLEKEKRKKGYEDLSAVGDGGVDEEDEVDEEEDEDERPRKKASAAAASAAPASAAPKAATSAAGPAAAPPVQAAPAGPAHADYAVAVDGRTVDVRLTRDGAVVRTVVVERFASPDEAGQAFERLRAQMVSDGYSAAPARDSL
jgi:predicted DNA-binding WGR domain protein